MFIKKTSSIEVLPYHPEWPILFEKEAELIKEALGPNFLTIYHVGSTSIPGLSAKPIIDIVPVVKDIIAVDDTNNAMEKLGYKVSGERGIPFRCYFSKPKYHVHVFEQNDPSIDQFLAFRNLLRNNADDAKQYEIFKYELASQPHKPETSFISYTLQKDALICKLLQKSGFNRLMLRHPLSDREWNAYHRIQQEQIGNLIGIEYNLKDLKHSDENQKKFVLYKGACVIGIAELEFLHQTEAALRPFAIDTPYQNQRLGSQFLSLLEKWLKQQGKTLLRLHAHPKALSFYQRLSYEKMPFYDPNVKPHDSFKTIDLGKFL